jgi:hypothetical protein
VVLYFGRILEVIKVYKHTSFHNNSNSKFIYYIKKKIVCTEYEDEITAHLSCQLST